MIFNTREDNTAEEEKKYWDSVEKERTEKNRANREILELSYYETFSLQEERDQENIDYINNSFNEGEIDAETRDYLIGYYRNTMENYGKLYYALKQTLGEPKSINLKDLKTGEITELYREDGKPAVYDHIVTPGTSVVVEFEDYYGNPLYLSMPGVKNVERAIDKVKIGSKYDLRYKKEIREALNKKAKPQKKVKAFQQIRKPYERLNDIFRCSISVKYYDNIKRVKDDLDDYNNSFENLGTIDKFLGNKSPFHKGFQDNRRNYRDNKGIYALGDHTVEIQFKLQDFDEADVATHKIYEELRQVREGMPFVTDDKERAQKEATLTMLELESQQLYRHTLDRYNRKVLETAAEMEVEEFKKKWQEKMSVAKDTKALETILSEYDSMSNRLNGNELRSPRVEKFIKDNYLVRPFKAFNKEDYLLNIDGGIDYSKSKKTPKDNGNKKFTVKDDFALQPNMKNFILRYYDVIEPKHITNISGTVFDGYGLVYDDATKEAKAQEQDLLNDDIKEFEEFQKEVKIPERKLLKQASNRGQYAKNKLIADFFVGRN